MWQNSSERVRFGMFNEVVNFPIDIFLWKITSFRVWDFTRVVFRTNYSLSKLLKSKWKKKRFPSDRCPFFLQYVDIFSILPGATQRSRLFDLCRSQNTRRSVACHAQPLDLHSAVISAAFNARVRAARECACIGMQGTRSAFLAYVIALCGATARHKD